MLYSYVDVDTLNSYCDLLKRNRFIVQDEDEILFTQLLEFDRFVRKINLKQNINYVVPQNCHPILLGILLRTLSKIKKYQTKIFNLNEAKNQISRIEFFRRSFLFL